MTIDFYYTPGSAPCRNVLLAAKALGVPLNLKLVDLHSGEHLKPEYVKMNPQHCVPTLVDDGFVIWESRAIQAYLADKYGKDDSLYPKDPRKRAVVNQRLFFDAGTLYQAFGNAYYPTMFAGAPLDPENVKKIHTALEFLELFLTQTPYVAGNNLTIADLAIVATITTIQAVDFDLSKYPKITSWLTKMKSSVPGYEEANGKGSEAFKQFYLSLIKK